MNSQKNLEKFFTRGDGMYIAGSALLVSGLLGIWIGYSFNFFVFVAGAILAPAGLLLFLIGSIGRIGQEDIDKAVADRLWNYDKVIMEDPQLGKRIALHHKSVSTGQFVFEGDNLMSKRGKDRAWRTSQYAALRILFLKDALVFIHKTVSILVDDVDGGSSTERAEYKYTELESAEIVRDSVRLNDGKVSCEAKRARLKIKARDGRIVLFVQVNDDMSADQLADNINRLIKIGFAE